MKVDILAIGVHPDDVELSCSGTLLRHIAKGKKVGLLDLTRGELGTRGSAEIREKEARESAGKMGVLFRENAGMADGFFTCLPENILKIVRILRWCRPEIVLANAPDDRHPDHGRAAKLTAGACFYSGLVKIKTEDAGGQPQEQWRPSAVYHYIQDKHLVPDFVVDISDFMEEKMALVQTFRSQFYLPGEEEFSGELNTPISGSDFMEFLRAKARDFARPIGKTYAEGFIAARTIGVDDLFDLI
ncbi:MAG: bacillithiol biosynthesis deacetylase BshB1 [Saprospiraceae bacterium]|nr:MAG: bacillithiol biosynthesis deacetylase BshB1 [Saprospiraceae bacterium]